MQDLTFCVIENTLIAQDIFEMRLHCACEQLYQTFQPGQFMHIRVPNAPQLLLRRPISIHVCDAQAFALTLQYAVVGSGTQALSQLRTGEMLRAIAPVGRGFPLMAKSKNIWLVGGGIGTAPLYALTQAAERARLTAFLGFRDAAHVFGIDRWREKVDVHLYTDDGSAGQAGFVVDGMAKYLEKECPDVVYACGPTPMLRALSKSLPDEIACYVSLEERMGCGIGACLTCNCRIADAGKPEGFSHRRVCVDGPVFALREVMFG